VLIPIPTGDGEGSAAVGHALIFGPLILLGLALAVFPVIITLILLCNLLIFLQNAYQNHRKRKVQRLRFREAQIAYQRRAYCGYPYSGKRKQEDGQYGSGLDSSRRH